MRNLRAETVIQGILIAGLIISMYLQFTTGLADNGDFTRSMLWFTSGPFGIEPNWPPPDTKEFSNRFFQYWLPYWKLEWSLSQPNSSAVILWLPGVLINYLAYSKQILYLPILSLLPRLLLVLLLFALFKRIEKNVNHKAILLFSLGTPIVFLFSNTDYTAYLNSFYQEAATFIFFFLLLFAILFQKDHQSCGALVWSLTCVLLLASSKTAYLYWALLSPALFFIYYTRRKNWKTKKLVARAGALSLAFILTSVSLSAFIARPLDIKYNVYHSLFRGVLSFSNDPVEHLHRLGISDAAQCVDQSAFSLIGSECFSRLQNKLSHIQTLRVIYTEPASFFRMMRFALGSMQIISLDYLGKYAVDDPRSQLQSYSSPLNLWSTLKSRYFPKGYALVATLIAFACWFTLNLKHDGVKHDLALIGLLTTFFFIIDILVAVLANGNHDLIKHLFLSNILFDVAAIAFFNSIVIQCLKLFDRKVAFKDLLTWK